MAVMLKCLQPWIKKSILFPSVLRRSILSFFWEKSPNNLDSLIEVHSSVGQKRKERKKKKKTSPNLSRVNPSLPRLNPKLTRLHPSLPRLDRNLARLNPNQPTFPGNKPTQKSNTCNWILLLGWSCSKYLQSRCKIYLWWFWCDRQHSALHYLLPERSPDQI